MLSKIRIKLKNMSDGVSRVLLKVGIKPNVMTVIGLILSVYAAFLYFNASSAVGHIWLAAIVLAVSGFSDIIDGAMARLSNNVTAFGGFLDSVLDRYADSIVIFGIIFGTATNSSTLGISTIVWGIIAIFGSIIVSYTRAKADSLGVQLSGIGIAERPERILILIATSIFLRPDIGIFIIAILTNITVLQRGIHVYRKMKKEPKGSKANT
ncbi:MAG: archaetidylinositol phosphate synthase [Candidatus Bathyarchaeota archaeon]